MCDNCEVFAVIGTCLCEAFCFCCAEDVDKALTERKSKRKRKKRHAETANLTSTTHPIVSQPKHGTKAGSSIEMQLLSSADKDSNGISRPPHSETAKLTTNQS